MLTGAVVPFDPAVAVVDDRDDACRDSGINAGLKVGSKVSRPVFEGVKGKVKLAKDMKKRVY